MVQVQRLKPLASGSINKMPVACEADNVLGSLLPFLVILNPFALCLYLAGVMEDLESAHFVRVLTRASIISLVVFWIFAISGEALLVVTLGVIYVIGFG